MIAPVQETSTTRLFTRTLKPKMTDEEVRMLQEFLNKHGYIVATSGSGSPGNESNYFGPRTRLALMKFQEANRESILIPLGITKATGIFGSATQNFVNNILSGLR
jgi:peptidoglycan hydrolase-like protein with peptidoglycan-binding domain